MDRKKKDARANLGNTVTDEIIHRMTEYDPVSRVGMLEVVQAFDARYTNDPKHAIETNAAKERKQRLQRP